MKKILISYISLFLILSIILAGCSNGSNSDAATIISTQQVKQGDLQIGVYADGRITKSGDDLDSAIVAAQREADSALAHWRLLKTA